MTRLGKKILSAFIEVSEDRTSRSDPAGSNRISGDEHTTPAGPETGKAASQPSRAPDGRFRDYFDKLFTGANMAGPDYYEFSKMILAMEGIPDEQARFRAAFAGLRAQGLDKEKLLSTAGEYLLILTTDAGHFQATAEQTMQEKVHGKAATLKETDDRIAALTQEIKGLRDQIAALQSEIKENEEKIAASTSGYMAESGERQAVIRDDMEKIKHYIL